MKWRTTKPLILASASPRRKELLSLLGIPFTVKVHYEEDPQIVYATPVNFVSEVAEEKGKVIAKLSESSIVMSADTIVVLEQEILEKPKSSAQAKEMLKRLSGKTHSVYTSVCIFENQLVSQFCVETKVTFFDLSEEWIDAYVSTGDSLDKAGAYGIQTIGGLFVKEIAGDYNSVVGLPIARVYQELVKLKLIHFDQIGFHHDY